MLIYLRITVVCGKEFILEPTLENLKLVFQTEIYKIFTNKSELRFKLITTLYQVFYKGVMEDTPSMKWSMKSLYKMLVFSGKQDQTLFPPNSHSIIKLPFRLIFIPVDPRPEYKRWCIQNLRSQSTNFISKKHTVSDPTF